MNDLLNGANAKIRTLRAKLEDAETCLRADAAEDELKTLRRNAARDSLLIDSLGKRAEAAEARVTFLKSRFDDLACQIEDSRYYGKTSVTGPTKFLYEIADRCRVTLELLNHVGGAK